MIFCCRRGRVRELAAVATAIRNAAALTAFKLAGLQWQRHRRAADYSVWLDTLGRTGSGLVADGNANGAIDVGGCGVWRWC